VLDAPSVARPVAALIDELARLPQIGPKTAQRLAYFILRAPVERAQTLAQAILDVKEKIVLCDQCFNLTEEVPCAICASLSRDHSTICVVEDPIDILSVERTHVFRGLYHVLHGALNPLEGIGPDELKIAELVSRVRQGGVREVILATNPTLEGDATADFITKELRRAQLQVATTRIGRGLPIGGDLEYADDLTISRALESRRPL
jgi:recombination protein RecR